VLHEERLGDAIDGELRVARVVPDDAPQLLDRLRLARGDDPVADLPVHAAKAREELGGVAERRHRSP
jgi:hypothetical protein